MDEMKDFLEEKVKQYNQPFFIESDPVQVPHLFSRKEDIEIAGFFTATIAWGQRATIIKNAREMMEQLEFSPFDFIMHASSREIEQLSIVHRTFNSDDFRFFVRSLQNIYKEHDGLESAFTNNFQLGDSIFHALTGFRKVFFKLPHPARVQKHVSNPAKGASAKRLNMFLRWMARKDASGVDFGIWKSIPARELLLPLDVHTGNVARALGLLERKQNDWKAVLEVTGKLKELDPTDPVKYDFALFGLGMFEDFTRPGS